MLIIRKEQESALAAAAKDDFVDRMLVHLKKFFPDHYAALGDDNCRELVHHGIERAESYDIISEKGVCKYVDVMVSFGVDFDTDPSLPWAAKILNDNQWKNGSEKADALLKTGVERLEEKARHEQ